ncbi:ATP-dependent DNA helicase DDM1-like [Hibiscus syriacus]|uniref:ATP-dependent DNA helicase DDM1-like n=1 Tax=Hibiscus syriacus TaxID=106335 RepID=A0A6A2ZR15_HIBSY|nr:sulfite exporter TauE/SafE family protein 3-like isoform X2 [Hibiscus syriacus]KAE8694026.1 ATP-dependent DNA helicase DDM1-like [Hibiscus syriacus]
MAQFQVNRRGLAMVAWATFLVLVMMTNAGIAERTLKDKTNHQVFKEKTKSLLPRVVSFLWKGGKAAYEPVWPEMEFGWKIVVGTIVGFLGAALGSVGGVGGGGFFVPMLTLIIGFDPKSSTAISKCMIMGAAGSTVYYNLRLRHPTLEMPLIDYDLALLFQPMLMLGISIGVTLNILFADWMVTLLLIILFIGTSTKALIKGVDTWKKETVMKKEAARLEAEESKADGAVQDYKLLPSGPNTMQYDDDVPLVQNIYWKELSLLVYVWIGFLVVQIIKEYLQTCSVMYWIVNSLQIPIAASVTAFEAICLYKGRRVIASKGKEVTNWKIYQLLLYCSCGIIAGVVGGLLGLGGGFILGPLFLELGIPPQVASATSTFSMVFSSSMSVVQYYLLNRFPIPYAAYFVLVATIAAFTGQHVVRKIIAVFGRASIIIFVLALTIFISAISLGGVGIADMVEKLEDEEYMGFENLCKIS